MSLFEKFSQARALEQALMEIPINPTGTIISEVVSASVAIIDGQPKIMAGTNNYLGLTFDPDCVAAGQQAPSSINGICESVDPDGDASVWLAVIDPTLAWEKGI